MSDLELIKKFLSWCQDRGFNQSDIAGLARRSRSWSSLLVNGKIKRLQFDTRARLTRLIEGENEIMRSS